MILLKKNPIIFENTASRQRTQNTRCKHRMQKANTANFRMPNFWPIEVNGRNFSRIFCLKNPQISQHLFWKLVYSLKVLCVGICYQIISKCNWARNQRKLQFCLTTPFFINQLQIPLKSVISDMLWAVRITDWTLVRIYWAYLSLSFLTYFKIEILKYGHTTQIRKLIYNFYCKN